MRRPRAGPYAARAGYNPRNTGRVMMYKNA